MTAKTWGDTFGSATVSAMQGYEDTLVGPLFTPWARLLVAEAAVAAGDAVCDVACGPGSVARVAAAVAGPGGRVIGCDISEGMLAVARAKPALAAGAPIAYVQGPADGLPLDDASVDVVLCQQGLQFFPDKPAALREMRRVLRAGGRLGVAVWDAIEHSPVFAALANAVETVGGAEIGARYRGGPWGLSDARVLEALVREAGFSEVAVERHALPVVFSGGPAQLYTTLTFAGIAGELAAQDERAAAQLRDAVDEALAPMVRDGRVESVASSHVVRASR